MAPGKNNKAKAKPKANTNNNGKGRAEVSPDPISTRTRGANAHGLSGGVDGAGPSSAARAEHAAPRTQEDLAATPTANGGGEAGAPEANHEKELVTPMKEHVAAAGLSSDANQMDLDDVLGSFTVGKFEYLFNIADRISGAAEPSTTNQTNTPSSAQRDTARVPAFTPPARIGTDRPHAESTSWLTSSHSLVAARGSTDRVVPRFVAIGGQSSKGTMAAPGSGSRGPGPAIPRSSTTPSAGMGQTVLGTLTTGGESSAGAVIAPGTGGFPVGKLSFVGDLDGANESPSTKRVVSNGSTPTTKRMGSIYESPSAKRAKHADDSPVIKCTMEKQTKAAKASRKVQMEQEIQNIRQDLIRQVIEVAVTSLAVLNPVFGEARDYYVNFLYGHGETMFQAAEDEQRHRAERQKKDTPIVIPSDDDNEEDEEESSGDPEGDNASDHQD